MKKEITALTYLLLCLFLFSPLCHHVCRRLGYSFELRCSKLYYLLTGVAALLILILSLVGDHSDMKQPAVSILALSGPLSLPAALFAGLYYDSAIVIISMALCVCICIGLTTIYARSNGFKIVALILCGTLIRPAALFLMFSPLSFGSETVVKSELSPDRVHIAEMIAQSEGALGGSTVVYVREDWVLDFGVAQIRKQAKQVYYGDWGEFNTLSLTWKDNEHLCVGYNEYEIP